ncbi:FtsX-like permease family protein [Qaidamihabitans albus]|uniref:FtsX-like permease family protein n=1 Tax=Qaidamihabitans albus TaxID=2795733 RepID=UPI0018F1DE5D|nr:FtsX-like permease family protein [Qaidamihabitans albus]
MNWLNDLALGVRLAVGGGRTLKAGLLRLVLTTIGIGLSTAVLLLLAGMASALDERGDRIAAREAVTQASDGTPVHTIRDRSSFRGEDVIVTYLDPAGPGAPVPPGLREIPEPGEMVVSPALADRLQAHPALDARFNQRVTGTVAPEGLADPTELWAYAGGTGVRDSPGADTVYSYGAPSSLDDAPPQILFIGGVGAVVLLVPLLVFVATTSRISGAERERRLSALRLAGARVGQVRRIAAAEAVVGAVAGGLLGLLLFLAFRPLAEGIELAGIAFFPADLRPAWPLVAAVLLLAPVLAVGSAWFGMRGLIVEPLGVLRRARPVRRRGWWRILLVVVGVALLLPDKLLGAEMSAGDVLPFLTTGSLVLLIGVPTLMPWLTERSVGRFRGGFPAWQLAIRRLQLDSGTPSRVVAGVVVVLAGAIALHSLLGSAEANAARVDAENEDPSAVVVNVEASVAAEALELVRQTRGVQEVYPLQRALLYDGTGQSGLLLVAPCDRLERSFRLPGGCAEGDSFTAGEARPGETLTAHGFLDSSQESGVRFTVPHGSEAATVRPGAAGQEADAMLLATPGAISGLALPGLLRELDVRLDPGDPDALARMHAALSPLEWRASIFGMAGIVSSGRSMLDVMQGLLYAGSGLTMLLAGASLLVTAAGQISERRRPLAAMSAGGVPRGVLARSLLWQNAVPMVFGVLVAVGVGIGVAALITRLLGNGMPLLLDGAFIAGMAGAAVVLVLGVTAATLPALRSATSVKALRAE